MAVVAAEARQTWDARSRRDRVIEENLGLVNALARRFTRDGDRLEDLVQVGAIGLINAADRFDARRGVDFRAYAVPTIVGEIKRYLRDHTGAMRIPRRDQQARNTLRVARRELRERLHHTPTWRELARSGAVAEDEATRALRAERATSPVPLWSIAETRQAAVEDEGLAAGENRELVREALEALTPRERQVVSMAYFDGLSQRELAAALGISQSHASRLLLGALAKMRAALGLDLHCVDADNVLDS